MNQEHPSISVVMKFNPANLAESVAILAEDAIWHYFNPELPEIKFDYAGLEGITDFFQKMAGHSKGTFKVNPISITPYGDELVVTNSKNKMILGEREIEIDAVVVWRIVDGKIKEA